jgi:hypothetical protein
MNVLFYISLIFLGLLSWCSNNENQNNDSKSLGIQNKWYCIDVTSYDYDRNNDMKCYKSNGEIFYTNYEWAKYFETNN